MNTPLHTRLSLFLLLILLSVSGRAQLWLNGGFENWAPNCPFNTAPNDWTNYSTSLGPDQAGTCAGTVSAFEGTSYMNLVWINSGLQEGASQTVTGLTIGTEYRISFHAVNSNGLYANPGDGKLEVHQNSLSIFSTPNMVAGGSWTAYSLDFTATSPTETFAFRVVPGDAGTSGSVGVDAASITELVSVRDHLMHVVKVWPNPVLDGRLRIDQGDYLTADMWEAAYSIQNMLGQVVMKGSASFDNGTSEIDVAALQPGVYVLQLDTELGTETFKFQVR